MNSLCEQQRRFIGRGPVRVACGVLGVVAGATAGAGAPAENGGAHGLHTSSVSVSPAPAIVPGTTPMPPPSGGPVILPGAPSDPTGADQTREIPVVRWNATERRTPTELRQPSLPTVSPSSDLSPPAVLDGVIQIVPQPRLIERLRSRAADQVVPVESRPPEVQILPAPLGSEVIELPAPPE